MPGAPGRPQGLVKKAAGALPPVCKLSSAFGHLSLLFVFLAVPNGLSPCCRCCRPAWRGPNKGVAMADGWQGSWDSLDGLVHLPALRGRAGTSLAWFQRNLCIPSWCRGAGACRWLSSGKEPRMGGWCRALSHTFLWKRLLGLDTRKVSARPQIGSKVLL